MCFSFSCDLVLHLTISQIFGWMNLSYRETNKSTFETQANQIWRILISFDHFVLIDPWCLFRKSSLHKQTMYKCTNGFLCFPSLFAFSLLPFWKSKWVFSSSFLILCCLVQIAFDYTTHKNISHWLGQRWNKLLFDVGVSINARVSEGIIELHNNKDWSKAKCIRADKSTTFYLCMILPNDDPSLISLGWKIPKHSLEQKASAFEGKKETKAQRIRSFCFVKYSSLIKCRCWNECVNTHISSSYGFALFNLSNSIIFCCCHLFVLFLIQLIFLGFL